METLKAAIIDDGANPIIFKNQTSLAISHDLEVTYRNFDDHYCSHATECISIINKYTDVSNVDWFNICVLDEQTEKGSLKKFLKALDVCIEKKVNVVHLSIGSRQFVDFSEIESKITALVANGTIVVAALSNEGTITYPACLDNVIGVRSSDELYGNEYIAVNSAFDNICFFASSKHEITVSGVSYETLPSNSYSAPVITAKVLNLLSQNHEMTYEMIIKSLVCDAKEIIDDNRLARYSGTEENNIDIPIIGILLKDNSSVTGMVSDLCDYFKADGYYAEKSTEYEKGFRKLPRYDVPPYLKCLSEFCNSDLVIAGFSDDSIIKEFKSFDIIVTDSLIENSKQCIVNISQMNYTTETIYKIIIDKFS